MRSPDCILQVFGWHTFFRGRDNWMNENSIVSVKVVSFSLVEICYLDRKYKKGKENLNASILLNKRKGEWRVVWIGFWSGAPPHTSHSFASRERFQVSVRHIRQWRNCTSWLLLLEQHELTHIFCSLAHPNQVMSCKDNDWLLSQTFPEMIGGVTNTQHVISTMSFHSRKWQHTRLHYI